MGGLQLWIDPTFGASGDMLLGAFAGLLRSIDGDAGEALEPLRHLGVDGFELHEEQVVRAGLACHRLKVDVTGGPVDRGRHWNEIDQLIAGSSLPPAVIDGARATFRRLGEVEAAQHGVDIDDVHFHEVGAVDAIVDIVGTWLLLDAIGTMTGDPASVIVGPVGIGRGTVTAAHGRLPLPAPATLALLAGAPVRSLDTDGETCTPTGAALLATMGQQWGPIPSGSIVASARGAGGRNPETHPNVVTVVGLTSPSAAASAGPQREAALVIECNVDDVTPEVLAVAVQRLLDAGAHDAWVVPIVMKKGRAAHEVRVLTDHASHDALVETLLRETGSLGCRTMAATKHVLPRTFDEVTVRGQIIRMKVGPNGAKPELDDLVDAASATGLPVRQLDLESRLAWSQT